LRVSLSLVDDGTHTRVLALPFATHDSHALLKLVQLDFEAHPPRSAIRSLTVQVIPVEPRVVQHHLYTPPAPVPERLELTLAKIRAMVGPDKAGFPELLDTHRPDAWRIRSGAGRPSSPLVQEPDREFGLRLALRYFRPPLPAKVEVEHGRPTRLTAPGIAGRIVQAAGPWRSSGDWWTSGAWVREDWDVALTDGALYRLALNRVQWAIDASFD
jgi:protein ImuB